MYIMFLTAKMVKILLTLQYTPVEIEKSFFRSDFWAFVPLFLLTTTVFI